jgi:hypothetical protein
MHKYFPHAPKWVEASVLSFRQAVITLTADIPVSEYKFRHIFESYFRTLVISIVLNFFVPRDHLTIWPSLQMLLAHEFIIICRTSVIQYASQMLLQNQILSQYKYPHQVDIIYIVISDRPSWRYPLWDWLNVLAALTVPSLNVLDSSFLLWYNQSLIPCWYGSYLKWVHFSRLH